jgi:leucyl aminopeptidase
VEVANTDCEGRLVLCDLLAYGAARIKPDMIVDMATLTGAMVVALGPLATGIFSRDDGLGEEILEAGKEAGEKVWPMPLYDEYLEMMQKTPADLANHGGRYGGAITAALFLGEFVPKTIPWAHMDIAGPAFTDKPLADSPAGGTGAGVRTLIRWLEKF